MTEKSKKNPHEGHRQRMLKRYLQNGIDSLEEHEILEIFLFCAYSRCNTNNIAHDLISTFGSLKGVMMADYNDLLKVDNVGETAAAFICFMRDFIRLFQNTRVSPIKLNSTKSIIQYCRKYLSSFPDERLYILYLDESYNFVSETREYSDANTSVHFITRKLVAKAINIGCPNVVLVHVYPKDTVLPSEFDICKTKHIESLFENLSLNLIDHIIVNGDDVYSINQSRYMYRT